MPVAAGGVVVAAGGFDAGGFGSGVGCVSPRGGPGPDDVGGRGGGRGAGGLAGAVVRTGVVPPPWVGTPPVVELLPCPVSVDSPLAETRSATSGPVELSWRTAKV